MKNGLLKLVFASALAITLSSCGSTKPSQSEVHVHRYDTENVEWFWKQLQNKDYEAKATFTCLDCEEGEEGHSITEEANVEKATTREATCSRDGEYTYTATVTFQGNQYSATKTREYTDENAHHYVEVKEEAYLVSPASCEEDAVYYVSCEHCHEAGTQTFTDVGSKLGHDLVHHDAKTSTCQEHGNIEYYECDRCHKYFLSEDGEAVPFSEIELPLTHNMTYHAGTPATCIQSGMRAYYTCEYEPGVKFYDEAGESIIQSDDDLVIPALGHTFNEEGHCVRCNESIKDAYDMEEATSADVITPTTLSDYGIADHTSVPNSSTGSHIFGSRPLDPNGIDLWLSFNYQILSGDNQFVVYLFNQYNEAGIRFRLETNNAENDGSMKGYILADSLTDWVIFPKAANAKQGQEINVHIFAHLLDSATNKYRVGYQIGIDKMYNPVAYPGGTGDEIDSPLHTKEVTLGANYFANNANRTLRISGINNGTIVVSSTQNMEKTVVYQNPDGTLIGKKNSDLLELYDYEIEGKTLVGWFDSKGNRVHSGDAITTKTIVKPVFTDTKTNMFTLSDFQGEDQTRAAGSGETILEGVSISEGNSYDVYFTYQLESVLNNDNYFIFGIPYDGIDGQTRGNVRIDNYDLGSITTAHGYIYGGSLGGAGASGTAFATESGVRMSGYEKLLIHTTVTDNGNNNITLTVEFVNLISGASDSVSKSMTFNCDFGLTSEYVGRNKLAFVNAYNCSVSVASVF